MCGKARIISGGEGGGVEARGAVNLTMPHLCRGKHAVPHSQTAFITLCDAWRDDADPLLHRPSVSARPPSKRAARTRRSWRRPTRRPSKRARPRRGWQRRRPERRRRRPKQWTSEWRPSPGDFWCSGDSGSSQMLGACLPAAKPSYRSCTYACVVEKRKRRGRNIPSASCAWPALKKGRGLAAAAKFKRGGRMQCLGLVRCAPLKYSAVLSWFAR